MGIILGKISENKKNPVFGSQISIHELILHQHIEENHTCIPFYEKYHLDQEQFEKNEI